MPFMGKNRVQVWDVVLQHSYRCHDKETPRRSFSFRIKQDLRRKEILHFLVLTILLLPEKK